MAAEWGDEFTAFYAAHHDRLTSFVAHLSGWADAADIAHEVFTEMYRRWDEIEHPHAFAYRVASNQVGTRQRRRAVERRLLPSLLSPSTVPPPEEPIDPDQRAALLLLSRQDREILALRRVAGLSYREIAEIVGRSEQTVRQRHKAAADRLDRARTGDGIDASR